MDRFVTAAVLYALIVTLGAAVHAAEPSSADISAGRSLSLQVCTACHLVSLDQEAPPILSPPAQDFRSIANRPSTTDETLRRFLSETHRSLGKPGGMPNPQLTKDQTRQVAAFLMSLREKD